MSSTWDVTYTECNDGTGLHLVTATNKKDPSLSHSQPCRLVKGSPNLSSLTEERFDYIDQNLKYKPSDIIITSYPKCGTTWTEQCVLLLLCGGNKDMMDPSYKNSYAPGINHFGKIWPEATINQDPTEKDRCGLEFVSLTMEQFDNAPSPRLIKSHARQEHLVGCHGQGLQNIPEGTKVLIVSRNPLDACVSSYYHAFNPFKCGWKFDAWASVFLSGKIMFGSYFEWVKGWWEDVQKHPTKALWLQYEDMQTDPRGQIIKIAEYLEIPYTKELIDKVLLFSSFDSMKKQAEEKGGNHNGHLRQGKSGDWQNHFTSELVEEFRIKYTQELAGTGLVFPIGHGEEDFHA